MNILVGTGLFLPSFDQDPFKLSYGINAFYFAPTSVNGNIIQENLFTNLSYQYKTQHVPVYLAAKKKIDTNNEKYSVILDAGLGPNFMFITDYKENSLDGITLPDNTYANRSNNIAFSVSAGIGLRLNNVLGKMPLECGYRFFYLGQSDLYSSSNQLQNNLSTGDKYANALVCSVTV